MCSIELCIFNTQPSYKIFRLSETFNRFEIDALFTLEKESKDSQKRPNKSERRTSKYRESPETGFGF